MIVKKIQEYYCQKNANNDVNNKIYKISNIKNQKKQYPYESWQYSSIGTMQKQYEERSAAKV